MKHRLNQEREERLRIIRDANERAREFRDYRDRALCRRQEIERQRDVTLDREAVLRKQLALRDARIAALEAAVLHVLDDARPAPSPGSAIVGNHAITGLKNAMYVGSGPCERGGDAT